jgi:hypothetical protein
MERRHVRAAGGVRGRPDGSLARAAVPYDIVGILGSAPYLTSSRIASTSSAYAARQNGVAPEKSMPMRPVL